MKDIKKIQEFFSKPLNEVDLSLSIPDNTSYTDFAKAVAKVLIDDYGSRNFIPFMEVLHSELNMENSTTYNNIKEAKEKYYVAYNGKGFYGITTKSSDKIEGEYSKEEAEKIAVEKNKFLSEAKKEDKVDTITMDVPLFIRMLEYSREDAAEDMDLHDVTEKAISLGKERGILQMDDYDELIGSAEEIKEEQLSFINKARAKSSLKQFLSGKRDDGMGRFDAIVYGIDSDGKKHQIKYYNHLQDYEKFALGNNPDIKENVAPNHNGKAAPYGSGYKPLEERIAKALDQINEELCPAGKAYIKRRQAAGEKSSAYLSGRAVKVCKGQMSGRAKKK
jgi:hypothetical protein